MSVLAICGTAAVAAVLAVTLKRLNSGAGVAVSCAALVLIFSVSVREYGDAIIKVGKLAEDTAPLCGELMMKSLGVGLTVKIASDLCRDCGENGIAGGIEFAGKLEILMLCLPYIWEIISLSTGFLT